jgi:exosome complex component CSL4
MEKKLVLPGDHLSSAEEAEPGENTYLDKDEVYSAAAGENASEAGHAAVRTKGRLLQQPSVGMVVYGVVIKASLNKAVVGCISATEVDGGGRGVQFDAVLPVTAIRRDYVRDIRDEVKIGDIIKARIATVEKTGCDLSLKSPDCGIVVAFCPRCRQRMDLAERIFVCGSCGWKERRKLPLKEGETPPPEEPRERFGGGRHRGERGGFRHGGRDRGGFRHGGSRGFSGGDRGSGGFRRREKPQSY